MRNRYDETYAQRLIGTIFAILGAAFLAVSVVIQLAVYGEMRISPLLWSDDTFIVSFVFFQIGLPFLLLGIVFRVWAFSRRSRVRRLIREGDRITASIDDVTENLMVRVNRRFPYNILCSWRDTRSGITYHFRSGNIWYNPSRMLEEQGIKTVTVYVKRGSIKKYHVAVPGYDERDVYL